MPNDIQYCNPQAVQAGSSGRAIYCGTNGHFSATVPIPLPDSGQNKNHVVLHVYFKNKNYSWVNPPFLNFPTFNLVSLDNTGATIATATDTAYSGTQFSITVDLKLVTSKIIYGFSWSVTPNAGGDSVPDFTPDALQLFIISYS